MECGRCGAEFKPDDAHEGPSGEALCAKCSAEVGGRPRVKTGESFDEHAVPLEDWGGPVEEPETGIAVEEPAELGWRTLTVAGAVGAVAAAVTFSALMVAFPQPRPEDTPPAPEPPELPVVAHPPAEKAPPEAKPEPPVPAEDAEELARKAFIASLDAAASKLAGDFSNVKQVVEDLSLLEGQTTENSLAKLARAKILEIEKRHDATVEADYGKAFTEISKAVDAGKFARALELVTEIEARHRESNYYYMQGASRVRRERARIDDFTRKAVERAEAAALAALAAGRNDEAAAAYEPLAGTGIERLKALSVKRRDQMLRMSKLPVIIDAELAYWKAQREAAALLAGRDFAGAAGRLGDKRLSVDMAPRLRRDAEFAGLAGKVLARARRNAMKLKGREFTVGEISGKVLIVDGAGFRIRHAGTLHAFKLDELDPGTLGRLYGLDPDGDLGDAGLAVASMQAALGDLAAARESVRGAPASKAASDLVARLHRAEDIGERYRTAEELLPEMLKRARELKFREARGLYAEFCAGHVRADSEIARSAGLEDVSRALGAGPRLELEAKAPVGAGRLTACFPLEDSAETDAVVNALEPEAPGRVVVSEEGPGTTAELSVTDGLDGRALRLDGRWEHLELPIAKLVSARGGAVEFAFRPQKAVDHFSCLAYGHHRGLQLAGSHAGLVVYCLGWRSDVRFRPVVGQWATYRIEWNAETKSRALFVDGKRVAGNSTAPWGGTIGGPLRFNVSHNTGARGHGNAPGDYDSVKVFAKP